MNGRRFRHALILVLIGCSRSPEPSAAQSQSSGAVTVSNNTQISAGRRTAITQAVSQVAPAVVTVQTEVVERAPTDPFEALFGQPRARTEAGLGTGFIVRSDGVIVTNAHVVAGASRTSVMMRDGKTFPARILGSDETNDLAVLKIDANNLPVAKLGNSDNLLVGEWAIAIGNPYGFLLGNSEPSVSAGVISGTGRNLTARGEGSASYVDMIQTDAAINPGNSGGPLVNADGEVIGVNSNIYSTSGGSIGLGFAIPIERAMRVTEEILRRGEMHRAWTGIDVAGARQMQLTRSPDGLRIDAVATGSPAAIAGLKAGDLMILANGQKMRTWLDWEAVKLDVAVGDTVLVEVKGPTGAAVRRRIRTGELPSVTAEKVPALQDIQLVTVTPAIRAERRIAASQGALIFSISPEAARFTGLQSGDVILAINNSRVEDASAVGTTIERLRPARGFRVFFERDRRIRFTDLSINS